MTEENLPEAKPLYVDRQVILKALTESNAAMGFVPDHTGTIQEIRDQMVKNGVRHDLNSNDATTLAAGKRLLRAVAEGPKTLNPETQTSLDIAARPRGRTT